MNTKTTLVLAITIALSPVAHAGEIDLSAIYGKGVSSNPNADLSAYSVSWPSGRLFGQRLSSVVMLGETYGEQYPQKDLANEPWPGQPHVYYGGGAKAFKFVGVGKEITFNYSHLFTSIGVGVLGVSRTADVAQYSSTWYSAVAIGLQYKNVSIAIVRFTGGAPGLSDPWTGEDYDAPAYQGFQVKVGFNLSRRM